jgi:magnesium transporter
MSSVFIPLTFMVGLWGMNFQFMPEIHTEWGHKYGYLFALGSMTMVAVGVIFWMKRKRWF